MRGPRVLARRPARAGRLEASPGLRARGHRRQTLQWSDWGGQPEQLHPRTLVVLGGAAGVATISFP